MPRYIDTTVLLWIYEHECEKYSDLEEMVADVPTADVVEVVRCKECVLRWTACPMAARIVGNLRVSYFTGDDDFCSRGKRLEDAEIH